MTSITVNLTLEQVLEFVQNLPLEYKQAVKQKLEEEKVEETNLINTIVVPDQMNALVLKGREKRLLSTYTKSVINKVKLLEETSEVEKLQEAKQILKDTRGLQQALTKLKETIQKTESESIETEKKSKRSLVDEITGIIEDDNPADYKTLRDRAIIARYKDKEERADKEQKEREQEKKDKELTIEERRAIIESLGGSLKVDLPEDFDYKKEYRNLIIKKYTKE